MEQVRLQGLYGIGTDTCADPEGFHCIRFRCHQRVYRNGKVCSFDRLEEVKTEIHIFNIYEVRKMHIYAVICIFMQMLSSLCKKRCF